MVKTKKYVQNRVMRLTNTIETDVKGKALGQCKRETS